MREHGYTWNEIANALMVSRVTIWRRLHELGMTCSKYTKISNHELDAIISGLVQRFPLSIVIMIWGHLKSLNIIVSRAKIRDSMLRVCSDSIRSNTAIRRKYSVPAPNCLWHIDGLHCLIRWRIVIHGGIDGFSRQIVYLRASDNNTANTVSELFRSAVSECGWPSIVRSDKGGENIEVARLFVAVAEEVI